MKVQSRIGITIPKDNLSCCCAPTIYRPVEDPLDNNLVLIPYGCVDFDIEWQIWDVIGEEWIMSQVGGSTYTWGEDGERVRVKMSKEGCCDVYSQAKFYNQSGSSNQ